MEWTREKLESLVDSAADHYGVPRPLARAIVGSESAWKIKANSGKAHGIMQLAPATAAELGVTDIYDPVQNIDGGMRYIKKQLNDFGRVDLALAAYNAGPNAVKRYGGIPPYEETQGYVAKILKKAGNFVMPTAQADETAPPKAEPPVFAKDKDGNRYQFDKTLGEFKRIDEETPIFAKDKDGNRYQFDKAAGEFRPVPAEKSLVSQVIDTVQRPGLMATGGMAGALVGGPVGGLLGAGIGATVDRAIDLFKGEPVKTGAAGIVEDATGALAQEVGGALVGKALDKGVSLAKRALVRPDAGQIVKDYTAANVPITAGAVSRRGVQLAQEGVASLPGGAGRISQMADDTAKAMDDAATAIGQTGYTTAMPKGSMQAGQAIQRGAEKTLEKFDSLSAKYYSTFKAKVPLREAPAVNTETLAAMDDLVAPIPAWMRTAAESSKSLDDFWKLRQAVGDRMATRDLRGVDLSQRELKRLYAAMSEDIKTAIRPYGDDALKSFEQGNTFFRRAVDKVNGDVNRVLSTFGSKPDKVFDTMLSGGTSAIRNTKAMVDPKNWDIVQAEAIRRMGLAKSGQQDATTELFSPQTFLTNYAKLEPQARKLLFGGGGQYRDLLPELDRLARISGSIRDMKSIQNTSGTARIAGVMDLMQKVFSHPAGMLAGAGAGVAAAGAPSTLMTMGGANLTARLFTSQKFVRYLADTAVKKDGSTATKWMGRFLAGLASQELEDADAERAKEYLLEAAGVQ